MGSSPTLDLIGQMKVVERTCTEFLESGTGADQGTALTLDELRGTAAYVLIAAPGAGKTTSFEKEAQETGGTFVSARDFVTLAIRPEWQRETLFIDGLDEIRAGSSDPRHPLDRVRTRLDELGRPEFRISCRDVDWLGANDREHLKPVSPNGTVRVFRLDPLNEQGIFQIVLAVQQAVLPEDFVKMAHQRGIEDLLENPQSLRLLLRAASSGKWPESRMETFERACESLARETNDEHIWANPDRPGSSALLESAGRLCAILIMTGRDGYSLLPVEDDRRIATLSDAIPSGHETARYVVRSRLFKSIGNDIAAPVHRYVAEFLAGRYLAGLVGRGTPASRVLAPLTGYDGYLVSEFQGLSAWLAAHCKESRILVMERDPVGTLLYGDVSGFSCEEKTRLIRVVAQHLERHRGIEDLLLKGNSGLAGLATPDMADSLLAVLRRPDRDSTALRARILALRAIQYASCDPRFRDAALELLENENSHPQIRSEALDAHVNHAQDSERYALLDRVWKGTIADPDDDLLGRLLTDLYPTVVGPSQVISYLRAPRNAQAFGSYRHFWTSRVRYETDRRRIAELLDALAANQTTIRQEFDKRCGLPASLIRHLPSRLLARYLESEVSAVDSARITDWLELVSGERISPTRADDYAAIRQWMADRPGAVKSIFRVIAERWAAAGDCGQCADRAQRLMLGIEFPLGFESWCYQNGRRATDECVAKVFLSSGRLIRQRGGSKPDSSTGIAGKHRPQPSMEEVLEKLLAEDTPNEEPVPTPTEEATDAIDPEKLEWRSQARAKEHLLRQNRCSPAFLEGLAKAYFGNSYVVEGADPEERLRDLLGAPSLVEAALTGLRGSVTRDDVPTVKEILRLHSEDRWHRLALPVLAGLEEIDRGSAPLREFLGPEQMRVALAFHFTTRRNHPAPYESAASRNGEKRFPQWYLRLVESHPALVADMMIESVRSEIRKGLVLFEKLLDLVDESNHAEIARRVSLPLLNLIPVRCSNPQLDGLEVALKSALKHCDKIELRAVVEQKLGLKSMTDGQRVYWLAASLFVDSSKYRPALEQYVALDDQRIGHLVAFVAGSPYRLHQDASHLSFESLDAASLESLVLRGGKLHRPLSPRTQAVQASALIEGLVRQLANDSSEDATESLQRLLLAPHLESWRFVIRHWQRRQLEVRRNASYAYPSIEQVRRTLDCSSPTNATDLLATAVHCLQELASEIRDGNTSGWRQFWNWGETPTATHEDLCRDHLLDLVRDRLKSLAVDAQPEGRYADDKRADIRVSIGTFNVPVEIKKSTHQRLWTALRSQLIRQYVRDPGTNGHGIYLVLWFGKQGIPMPPSGRRPQTAAELQQRLQDSLSIEEKLKISIIVIDVSRSGGQ